MSYLGKQIQTISNASQDTFNGIFELKQNDILVALDRFLLDILGTPHKPKWKLFPLYVIYQLLCNLPNANRTPNPFTVVAGRLANLIWKNGIHGPGGFDIPTLSSFMTKTLRANRPSSDIDELTDLNNRRNPFNNLSPVFPFIDFVNLIVGYASAPAPAPAPAVDFFAEIGSHPTEFPEQPKTPDFMSFDDRLQLPQPSYHDLLPYASPTSAITTGPGQVVQRGPDGKIQVLGSAAAYGGNSRRRRQHRRRHSIKKSKSKSKSRSRSKSRKVRKTRRYRK